MKLAWRVLAVVVVAALAWVGWQVFAMVLSCVREPWSVYAMDTPPDEQCSEQHVGAIRLYVWRCVDGERVAITKQTGEMFPGPTRKSTGACGQPTEAERELRSYASWSCRPGAAPPWGDADGVRPPVIERVYESTGSRDDASREVQLVLEQARPRLDALDDFASLERRDDRLILILPATATDAEIEAADRVVNVPPMHMVSSATLPRGGF